MVSFSSLILATIGSMINYNPCLSQSSVCDLARNADCNNNGNSPDNPGCNVCNNNVCGQCSGQNDQNGFFKVSNHLDYCIPCSNILGCDHCADNNGCQQCIDSTIPPTDIYNCGIKICYPDSDTPDPTSSPTDNPTNTPTDNPSASPTMVPTIAPSNSPTLSPTAELTEEEYFTLVFESIFSPENRVDAFAEDAIVKNNFLDDSYLVYLQFYSGICDLGIHSIRKNFLVHSDNGALSYDFYNSCHSSINGFFWMNGRTSILLNDDGLIQRITTFLFEESDFDYIRRYGESRLNNSTL